MQLTEVTKRELLLRTVAAIEDGRYEFGRLQMRSEGRYCFLGALNAEAHADGIRRYGYSLPVELFGLDVASEIAAVHDSATSWEESLYKLRQGFPGHIPSAKEVREWRSKQPVQLATRPNRTFRQAARGVLQKAASFIF